MSGKPRIGITTYGPLGKPPMYSLPVEYVRAVSAAGGLPLLLTAETPLDQLLDAVDALILAGGGDMDPSLQGPQTHETIYGVVRARDDFELALARAALARTELPVLGICRGMQVMNVATGGDLELHLPDTRGESVLHRAPPREPIRHRVRLEPDNKLGVLYGAREFEVCSWHHQELRRLGKGVRPVAFAPDGVIEAIVYEPGEFAVGVQWHPELQAESDPLQRRIFEALVLRAREKR